MLQKRINDVKNELAKTGREVTLIAVTKTHPVEVINEAIDCGITDIGENKVQEVLAKYDAVKPVRWHLIGHLQTNKVRQIVDKVYMIHSVDSEHLAKEIDKRCAAIGKAMNILIQVNVAGEDTKSGVSPDEVPALAEALSKYPNLKLRGLMQIAPYADDPEEVRPYFKRLKEIFDELKPKYGPDFDTISMGMSNDYVIAAEEGATCVRVGTLLFGERDYTKQ